MSAFRSCPWSRSREEPGRRPPGLWSLCRGTELGSNSQSATGVSSVRTFQIRGLNLNICKISCLAKHGHLPTVQAERAGAGSLGAEGERGERGSVPLEKVSWGVFLQLLFTAHSSSPGGRVDLSCTCPPAVLAHGLDLGSACFGTHTLPVRGSGGQERFHGAAPQSERQYLLAKHLGGSEV